MPQSHTNFVTNFLGFKGYDCNELRPNLYLKIYGTIDDQLLTASNQRELKVDKFYIKIDKNSDYRPGERVKVVGKPELRVINRLFKQIWLINPEIIKYENLPDGEKIRFTNSASSRRIWQIRVRKVIDFIRLKSLGLYLKILPEPQAGLLSGIVLGESGQTDREFWQALRKTGTLHLIAASGMNVALVAKISLNLLVAFLKRRQAYFVTLVSILIYCLLAGGSASVVRAGLMSGLALFGLAFGREAAGGWLLFLAAGLMLLFDPSVLFDTGFQLSVAAMAGMIWVRPLLQGSIFQIRTHFKTLVIPNPSEVEGEESSEALTLDPSVRSIGPQDDEKLKGFKIGSGKLNLKQTKAHKLGLASSLLNSTLDTFAAQIATFPILYFTFGQIQLWSFLPNLMVIPAVAPLMMLGFLILAAGLIWLPLAYPLAWLAWPVLTYFVGVIEWWGRLLN